MKVERIHRSRWPEAYRCTAGPAELTIVTSMGPRIVSLRLNGGENLLYEDATDFKVGDWRLGGGHRFTVAPESEGSYVPDNQRCEVELQGGGLWVQQLLGDGLLRRLEITPNPECNGFILRHVLRNCRAETWRGAPWAITCVPPSGRVVIPLPNGPAHFWNPPGAHYAGASSSQWQSCDDCFVVLPQGQKGKVGRYSELGWLAWLLPELSFVIRGPARDLKQTYPDDGCNLEVYTCADYVELETLGPLATLLPGQKLVHLERWQLVLRGFPATAWRALDEFTQPDSARAGAIPLSA